MAGPNSAPNGDTRIVRGHVDEEFVCEKHRECDLDTDKCQVVPLRWYLSKRNRLRTGKTR